MTEERETTIASLRTELADMEGNKGLSRFVGGHGLMSRLFVFQWSEPTLEIDFRLPYARVLADDEGQKEDDAEIGAAIRMAILLMTVEDRKVEGIEEMRVHVWANERGVGYSIRDGNGNDVDSGDDWSGLVSRLETVLTGGEEPLSIIWP